MKARYCRCGRKIVVLIKGKHKMPRDEGHELCRQCWKAEMDRTRDVEQEMLEARLGPVHHHRQDIHGSRR